jgi:hypothetical protein
MHGIDSVAFAANPGSIVALARLKGPSFNPRIISHPRIPAGLVTGIPNVSLLHAIRAGAQMEEAKWGRRKGIKQARNAGGGKLWVGMASSGNSDDLPETLKTVVVKKMGEGGSSIVLEPDFRLALSVLAIGLQLWKVLEWTTLGIFITIIGGFLTMQTARLRFRFTSSTIDVLRVHGLSDSGNDDGQSATGKDDAMRKTTMRAIGPWAFSSVVNWEFWWPGFPVLAYFKETQVKETGQRHFIPIIMDGKALYEHMCTNFGQSLTPKPPVSEWQNLQVFFGYDSLWNRTLALVYQKPSAQTGLSVE